MICSKASGLSGKRDISKFLKYYGPLVGEITHIQQIKLFEIAWREKVEFARGVYFRQSKNLSNPKRWADLNAKIKEVFIDTIYQGNKSAPEMVRIMAEGGSKVDIIKYLNEDRYHGKNRRDNLRREYLK